MFYFEDNHDSMIKHFFLKVSHTVVFVVEGLSSYHFMAYESMLLHIANNLKYHLEVITPTVYGASIMEELVAVPLTGTQSDKLIRRMYIYNLHIYIYIYFILT